ncbi:MAG TPA: PP2C family protein-serine/threonine phosphatase [Bacteroidota bacterium]|nr:PP2C family protein-serine/threonine phosphatase [Bacteroidota bacterium]
MPPKISPMKLWKTMERKDVLRLTVAVFFLFGTIGPLSMLMDSSILPGSWFRLIYLTILCGLFSASIILLIQKPLRLIVVLIVIMGAMIVVEPVETLILGRAEHEMVLTPDHLFTLTQGELSRIEVRRPLYGAIACILLATGYGLFIQVITTESRKRTRLETEIAVARNIQKSLQPAAPYKTGWCEAAGVTVPATEVGGDYFDVIPLSDDKVVVAIADVSGHGTGAGILSAMTKSALHTELHHTTSLSELMANLNSAVYDVTDKKMFVSFACLFLDGKNSSARISTAGHPPVLLIHKSDRRIEEIRTPNLALAVQASTKYEETTVRLEGGDALVLYTDGITEATNNEREQFGMDRLKELLADTERPSAEALSNSILASVRAFTVKKEFNDDATIVVVKIKS